MNARKVRLIKGDNNACPKCGSADVSSSTYGDTVDFRNLEFDVEGLLSSKCQRCGHVWTTHEQEVHNHALIRGGYAVERDRLRAQQGLLSGPEISVIREQLGLNQREAAALFGGGYNAFNKYESGEVLQSFAMDRLLRLTKAVGRPAVGFLKDVTSEPSFVVVSTASTFTASQAAYLVASVSKQTVEAFRRNVETVTDSMTGCFSIQEFNPSRHFWTKHETDVLSCR